MVRLQRTKRLVLVTVVTVAMAGTVFAIPFAMSPAGAAGSTEWQFKLSYLIPNNGNPEPGSVACPSTSDCIVVGSNSSNGAGGGILSTTDGGSTWVIETVPAGTGVLSDVACPSTSDCTAVGSSIIATTDGGSTWTVETAPAGAGHLDAVACPSTSICTAVGGSSILATTDGGSTWTHETAPALLGALLGVACPSASDCTAVGGNGSGGGILATTNGGSTWISGTAPALVTGFFSVACPSTSDCTAVGSSSGGDLILTGTPVPVPSTRTVLKLSATRVIYGHEQAEHPSVTVSSSHPGLAPTGTVTIKESATTLCVIRLQSGKGSCKLSPKRLKAGTYRLVATYGGSTNFKGSTSAKETLTVVK
jgi:hypothetical protein